MKPAAPKPQRCAIYTRVSTEHGLEQEFNSLHAQREAAQAYVRSQAHEGWNLLRDHYDDGGFSGASIEGVVRANFILCFHAPMRSSRSLFLLMNRQRQNGDLTSKMAYTYLL